MKMNKKKVVVTALALCLVSILSMGTLAWFSDADEVENEFYIATSDDTDPSDIFSVDVWEEGDAEDDGLVYTDIVPGDVLDKEVHVKNTGYYKQYVRVIVTVSDATAWRNVLGLENNVVPSLDAIVNGYDSEDWAPVGANYNVANDEFYYVLYYNGILESEDDITVFTDVEIPTGMTADQAAKFVGGFTVDVKAQAVQTENVGANAYEAFQTVKMDIE